jgi:hypothetical protein
VKIQRCTQVTGDHSYEPRRSLHVFAGTTRSDVGAQIRNGLRITQSHLHSPICRLTSFFIVGTGRVVFFFLVPFPEGDDIRSLYYFTLRASVGVLFYKYVEDHSKTTLEDHLGVL